MIKTHFCYSSSLYQISSVQKFVNLFALIGNQIQQMHLNVCILLESNQPAPPSFNLLFQLIFILIFHCLHLKVGNTFYADFKDTPRSPLQLCPVSSRFLVPAQSTGIPILRSGTQRYGTQRRRSREAFGMVAGYEAKICAIKHELYQFRHVLQQFGLIYQPVSMVQHIESCSCTYIQFMSIYLHIVHVHVLYLDILTINKLPI